MRQTSTTEKKVVVVALIIWPSEILILILFVVPYAITNKLKDIPVMFTSLFPFLYFSPVFTRHGL